jgi:NMD protein affecting ribosome stability and mRNA decay
MKRIIKSIVSWRPDTSNLFCKACGRLIGNVGAGTNCNGMCERCYENGGDDE